MAIMIIVAVLLVGMLILFMVNAIIDSKMIEEERRRKQTPVIRPATWRDGARAIGIDVNKYEKYGGALLDRYPMAMNNLIKLEWLASEMNSEEKFRVRHEYEMKFDEVVREEDQRQRDRMREEIENVMNGFKESDYLSRTEKNNSETDREVKTF